MKHINSYITYIFIANYINFPIKIDSFGDNKAKKISFYSLFLATTIKISSTILKIGIHFK